jgi:hypothetical protein
MQQLHRFQPALNSMPATLVAQAESQHMRRAMRHRSAM